MEERHSMGEEEEEEGTDGEQDFVGEKEEE